MAEGRESLDVWTRVSSAGDVLSLANSFHEASTSSERLPSGSHSRRDSEDAVTSPLKPDLALSAPGWQDAEPQVLPVEEHEDVQPAPESPVSRNSDTSAETIPSGDDSSSDAPRVADDVDLAHGKEPRPAEQPERGAEVADTSQGGWWASIATSVKRVAEGVSHDIEEINESIQKLLDDEQERDEGGSARQAEGEHERAEPERGLASESPETRARKEEILARLAGDDTEFESGIKAIDAQVEQLSNGLTKAFGSLWGSARGAVTFSQRMAQQMEAVAKEMGTQVQAGVREGHRGLTRAANTTTGLTSALAARAEQGLEALGQRAADMVVSSEATWPAEHSFRRHWQACGGQQSLEELEALGNESARACSALFKRLEPDACARFQASLESLVEAFDLRQQLRAANRRPEDSEQMRAAESALQKGHGPIAELQEAAISRAADLAEQQPHNLEDDIPKEAAELMRLRQMCAEGGKLLAELCAACVERLLAVGKSLSASSASARPSSDGVRWSSQPAANAQLLRKQAALLSEALRAVAEAFVDAISKAADSAAARAPSQKATLLELSDSLCTTLERDSEAGLTWIQEAFKGLVYLAVLSGKEWAT